MVYVGPERSGFVIHRNVSSNSSDVFKHWFELAFRENNGVVELPACDFIPFGSANDKPEAEIRQDLQDPGTPKSCWNARRAPLELLREWRLVSDCLILADYVQDKNFYNATIDSFIESCVDRPWDPTTESKYLYDRLPATSPALQFFVDLWVYHCNPGWWPACEKCHEYGPTEFWGAIAHGLAVKQADSENGDWEVVPWHQNRCKYHKHDEGDVCHGMSLTTNSDAPQESVAEYSWKDV